MAEPTNAELLQRIELLEKVIKDHLGPNFAQTSLNIPHGKTHTDISTINTNIGTLETTTSDLQDQINTAGRYL